MTTPQISLKPKEVHFLKTWPIFFAEVRNGTKPFELRKDDRDFQPGDLLVLQEWNNHTSEYTGEEERRDITYVLRGTEHLAPGYCAIGMATRQPERPDVRALEVAHERIDHHLREVGCERPRDVFNLQDMRKAMLDVITYFKANGAVYGLSALAQPEAKP